MKDRKPSWNVWANVPSVELLGAVALSLDIDPRRVKHSPHGWMSGGGGPFLEEGQEFLDRLEVATRNLGQSGPIIPLKTYIGRPDKCEVSIPSFGRWAKSIGWELPEEFPTDGGADISADASVEAALPQALAAEHEIKGPTFAKMQAAIQAFDPDSPPRSKKAFMGVLESQGCDTREQEVFANIAAEHYGHSWRT